MFSLQSKKKQKNNAAEATFQPLYKARTSALINEVLDLGNNSYFSNQVSKTSSFKTKITSAFLSIYNGRLRSDFL